jgi:hypothetical protein
MTNKIITQTPTQAYTPKKQEPVNRTKKSNFGKTCSLLIGVQDLQETYHAIKAGHPKHACKSFVLAAAKIASISLGGWLAYISVQGMLKTNIIDIFNNYLKENPEKAQKYAVSLIDTHDSQIMQLDPFNKFLQNKNYAAAASFAIACLGKTTIYCKQTESTAMDELLKTNDNAAIDSYIQACVGNPAESCKTTITKAIDRRQINDVATEQYFNCITDPKSNANCADIFNDVKKKLTVVDPTTAVIPTTATDDPPVVVPTTATDDHPGVDPTTAVIPTTATDVHLVVVPIQGAGNPLETGSLSSTTQLKANNTTN